MSKSYKRRTGSRTRSHRKRGSNSSPANRRKKCSCICHKKNRRKIAKRSTKSHRKKRGGAKKNRCWTGYEPVPGMKPYSKGSCRKVGKRRKSTKTGRSSKK